MGIVKFFEFIYNVGVSATSLMIVIHSKYRCKLEPWFLADQK